MYKFKTAWQNRPTKTKEENSGIDSVERAGYIPLKTRINSFLLAGRRLDAIRAGMYDDPSGKDNDIPLDPTRSAGFDMAEGSTLIMSEKARLKAKKQAKNNATVTNESKPDEKTGTTPDVKAGDKTPAVA